MMTIKATAAKLAGKSSYWFLHTFFKGGTSLPGKVATRIDPEILSSLVQDYEVIIVTGTNGKTMSTAFLVEALRSEYDDVLTNPSGSNMLQGIVTAFLTHHKVKTNKKRFAVLEVDEANVPIITKYLKPKAFVLTNLFRDQMDRYGEIYSTYNLILDGIKNAPEALVIANGDASIFSSKSLPNKTIYYGFETPVADRDRDFKAPTNTDGVLCPVCEHILHYHFLTYANLGDFFCPNCGFHRPSLKYQVTKIDHLSPEQVSFQIENQPLTLNIGGKYNIYNALLAYATASEMGVPATKIIQALQASNRLFGRQELLKIGEKDVNIILVKNPVGLNEVIALLNSEPEKFDLGVLLNANPADGIDTSWIWDGDFEALNHEQIQDIFVGGTRVADIALRLEVAGFPKKQQQTSTTTAELIEQIKQSKAQKVYILSTYTAMLNFRKTLAEQNLLKAGM